MYLTFTLHVEGISSFEARGTEKEAGPLGKEARCRCCTTSAQSEWRLSDDNGVLVRKLVEGNLQVEGGGAFPDAARGVVVGAVTGAVVTAVVAGVGDGHAAQMRAHAEDDDPAGVLDPVFVVLGVAQLGQVHAGFRGDLLLRAMADKQRLASPLEGHVLAFGDVAQLDFDLGQGQHVGRGAHGGDELSDHRLGGVDAHHGCGAGDQVGEGLPGFAALLG
ncbi:hypothetical protein EYF80_024420 [Liparis tanakae]|uniref:Uncharacterized protein n=1 Tax=Liparis tanakae TaxID=230148 RepID=A0A4Z2HKE3_9TELE|nr:hypothetical protein EYF80_024420 [Liparis tanakae]